MTTGAVSDDADGVVDGRAAGGTPATAGRDGAALAGGPAPGAPDGPAGAVEDDTPVTPPGDTQDRPVTPPGDTQDRPVTPPGDTQDRPVPPPGDTRGPGGSGDPGDHRVPPSGVAVRRWATSRRSRARARGLVAPHRGSAPAAVRLGASGSEPVVFAERTVARPRRSTVQIHRRRWVVLAGMGVLTAVGVGLAVGGLSAVRNSTVGRYETAAGPNEPGYRASVVPTPTMGVLLRADDGTLAGAAVLALAPEDAGGSVVLVPSATVVGDSAPDDPGGEVMLSDVYASDGAEAASQALAGVMTAAIHETLEVDSADWAALVGPVDGVEVTLDGAVADWPAGEAEVAAADVGRFLAARSEGEDDLLRVERQQEFWNAWLPKVREAGEGALPGEVDSGIGRFVRTIAAGEGAAATLPIGREEVPGGVVYRVDQGRRGAFVAQTIPFPTSPAPGTRIRVRVLNGSGDPALTSEAARALVAAGAEIDVIGNPDPLEQPETLLVHRGGAQTGQAQWLQTIIGGGRLEVIAPDQTPGATSDDEIDVTVILGQDAGTIFGREQTSD